MKLNDAYTQWKTNPISENYDILGESLLPFIQAVIATKFAGKFCFLEDATGESICEILRSLNRFDHTKGAFSNWVYGITFHTCIDMLRAKGIRSEQVLWTERLNERYVKTESSY